MTNAWVAPISFTASGKITAESTISATLTALDFGLIQAVTPDDLSWAATVELHRVSNIGSGSGLTPFALRDANAASSSPLAWRYGSTYTDIGLMAKWSIGPSSDLHLPLPFGGVITDQGAGGATNNGLALVVTFDSGFTGTLLVNAWYED